MSFLRKLLDLLPFNGQKTNIGAWLVALTALYQLDPEALKELAKLLTTSPINWAGVALLVVGLVHKYLKGAYPAQPKWGK